MNTPKQKTTLTDRLTSLSDKDALAVFHFSVGYSEGSRRSYGESMERALAWLAEQKTAVRPCQKCHNPMADGTERPISMGNPSICVPCATGVDLPDSRVAQTVAREAHNLEVDGAIPSPAPISPFMVTPRGRW